MDSNPGVSRQCWILESESRKSGQVVPRSRNLSEDCQSWRSRRHRDWCTRKCSILRPSKIQTKVTSHFSIDSVFVPDFSIDAVQNKPIFLIFTFFIPAESRHLLHRLQILLWEVASFSHCSWEFLWFSHLAKAFAGIFTFINYDFLDLSRSVISNFLVWGKQHMLFVLLVMAYFVHIFWLFICYSKCD